VAAQLVEAGPPLLVEGVPLALQQLLLQAHLLEAAHAFGADLGAFETPQMRQ